MQHRLADAGAVDLEFRDRGTLEAFDQHQIARREPRQRRIERKLRGAAQLVHQRPAHGRCDQYLLAACFAMTMRILARLVDVELMVRVFYQRDHQSFGAQLRYEPLDERRLAAARPAGEPENLHHTHRLPRSAVSFSGVFVPCPGLLRRAVADDRVDELTFGVGVASRIAGS